MLALGEEQCTRLFGMMHEDEIKDISSAMAQLGAVRADVVERLCIDFADSMGSAGNLVGSYRKHRAAAAESRCRATARRRSWRKSAAPPAAPCGTSSAMCNEAVLANYLKNEYPQTVAVVLSKVRPEHAARVLTLLPDSFAMEVVMRMLRMESVQKDVLDGVERTLRAEFMSNLARSTRRDAHEMMADIFNNLDRQSETRFLAALEERNREAAERIKSLMFTFDDLQRLTPAGGADAAALGREGQAADRAEGRVGKAARPVPQAACRNAPARCCSDDIEALGPVRLRDVDEAQAASCGWPRNSPRKARSRSARARMRS